MDDVAAGKKDDAVNYVYGNEYNTSIAKINQIKSNFLTQLDGRALGEVNRLIGVSYFISFCFFITLILVVALQVITYRFCKFRLLRPIIEIRDEMGADCFRQPVIRLRPGTGHQRNRHAGGSPSIPQRQS